jgi:hypothetical protein
MALSMEEQRILAQIEEQLAQADPGLAARLSSFGRAGADRVLSSRARIASLLTLALIAVVSVLVYTLAPFRGIGPAGAGHRPSPPGHPVMSSRGNTASARPASPSAGPSAARLASGGAGEQLRSRARAAAGTARHPPKRPGRAGTRR